MIPVRYDDLIRHWLACTADEIEALEAIRLAHDGTAVIFDQDPPMIGVFVRNKNGLYDRWRGVDHEPDGEPRGWQRNAPQ
jgi:hypothetical protein